MNYYDSAFVFLKRNLVKRYYLSVRELIFKYLVSKFIGKRRSIPVKLGLSILCIRVDRIGDMALTTPLFKSIKKRYPFSTLTVLTSHSNREIIRHNPWVDKCIVVPKINNIASFFWFLIGLNNNFYHYVLDPYPGPELKSTIFSSAVKSGSRVGYGGAGREIFYDYVIESRFKNSHFIDLTLAAGETIGASGKDRQPEIFLKKDEIRWAKAWMKKNDLGQVDIVAIHPGAHFPTQRWPTEYFAELINGIIRKIDSHKIILLGGPGEKSLIKDILIKIPYKTTWCIPNNLRQLISLMSLCRVMICNNSGPLHIAVSLDIQTVSFMGPTQKMRWRPLGKKHLFYRRDELPCIGCNSGVCLINTHECMKRIRPEIVLKDLIRLFGKDSH